MKEYSLLFRMRSWKWILLLIFSLVGMLILYGIVSAVSMYVQNVYANLVLSLAGCAVMCGIYALLSGKIERRPVTELRLRRLAPDVAWGCLIGGGCIALSVLGMWLFGVYQVDTVSPPWKAIFLDLLLFIVVAVGEELAFRGVLQRMIEERWGTTVAFVIACLVFGFVHYMNEGGSVWSSIAIAVSAVEAASYVYSRTLWMAIGTHFAWNFVQGNVFSFAVSGTGMNGSVIQPSISGPELLTGGAFGAEASVITVVISAAVTVWLLVLAIRKGNYIPFRNPWRRLPESPENTPEAIEGTTIVAPSEIED